MKKAELSINIIVIAAVALIILVVLSYFVFDWGSKLRRQTACEGIGGECIPEGFTCDEYFPDGTHIPSGESCRAQERCCIPLGG